MGIYLKWEEGDSTEEFHAEILPRASFVPFLLPGVNCILLPTVCDSPFPFLNHPHLGEAKKLFHWGCRQTRSAGTARQVLSYRCPLDTGSTMVPCGLDLCAHLKSMRLI